MSRPAVPGSETPLGECSGPFSDAKDCPVHKDDLLAPASCGHNDRFKCVFGLPREDNGCLACALERTERHHSLAQTEIKGLQAERDLHYTRLAGLLFSGALDKYTGGDVQSWAAEYTEKLDQAQARIAELEKDAARLDVLEREIGDSPLLLHNGGSSKGFRGLGLANTGRTLRKAIDDMTYANQAALKSRA